MLYLNKNNNKPIGRKNQTTQKTHRGELNLMVLCFGGIFPETELAWLAWFWAGKEKQFSCTVIKRIWNFGVVFWSSDGASPAFKCQVLGGMAAEPGWAVWVVGTVAWSRVPAGRCMVPLMQQAPPAAAVTPLAPAEFGVFAPFYASFPPNWAKLGPAGLRVSVTVNRSLRTT